MESKSEMGDYYSKEGGPLQKSHGINWVVASLFVVADMAGGGIVALPTAAMRCGFWPGIGLLAVMCVSA